MIFSYGNFCAQVENCNEKGELKWTKREVWFYVFIEYIDIQFDMLLVFSLLLEESVYTNTKDRNVRKNSTVSEILYIFFAKFYLAAFYWKTIR